MIAAVASNVWTPGSPSRRASDKVDAEIRRVVERLYGPPEVRVGGLDVGTSYWGDTKPFRYGGDLVDVFAYESGCASFAVVDIAGHGIAAARHAGLAKYALRGFASHGMEARECVRALNQLFMENSAYDRESDDEFFATVFFAIVDPARKTMQYVSAGHDAAFLVSAAGRMQLATTGPVVGILKNDIADFMQETIVLQTEDVIAVVTDGFTEARDAQDSFLGVEALADAIAVMPSQSAHDLARAVTLRAYAHAGARLTDDVAALVVKVLTQGTTPA